MPEINFVKQEEKILRFWKKNRTFEKSVNQRRKSKRFVFYEGPPTANAGPGIHHAEARSFKDIVCRYKTMRGYLVERKAGWDTHGLPVELQIEKKLGLNNKKEIEKYGIAKFNKECQKSVWEFKKEWEALTERIGYWVDLKNAYITYDPKYIESLWWILKKTWEKGLLYQGYKVIPYCSRCGTGLSSHEVAQGYKTVKDKTLFVKFKVRSDDKKWKNTSILSWTTTPWTLPGNVALAVNPDLDYAKIEDPSNPGSYLVVLKERIEAVLGKDINPEECFKGKELSGLRYFPLFGVKELEGEKSYSVYPAHFVSVDEGTGVVHIAPMYGEDDYQLAERNDLPKFHTVNEEGKFVSNLKDLAGLYVKSEEAEIKLFALLKESVFGQSDYEHDYPFCWRCKSPLIYYAKKEWFIAMIKMRKELLENNQKINWIPNHLKKGRFGGWLKEAKDWALSRERYWGTPLPIWICECGHAEVIGSLKEIERLGGKIPSNPHRPFIDKVTLKCKKCSQKMRRVSDVIDCWFDSGAMPFAQNHYPFEKKMLVDKGILFPADYISEAIDQTRGWFYTLLAISTVLGYGPAYRNVLSLGHILDKDGEKMSKSKGNIVRPWEMIEKYGADAIRWYFFTVNRPEDSKLFDEKDLLETVKTFFLILWNSLVFLKGCKVTKSVSLKTTLDKWIISRLNSVEKEVGERMEKFDIANSGRLIEKFLVEDLSQWYIRRSRDSLKENSGVLRYVLLESSKLLAPFVPFLAESIYQELKGEKESVHLCDYPEYNPKAISSKLEKEMTSLREITALALAKRVEAGIKVRQPLARLTITKNLSKDLLKIISEEINVKEVVFGKEFLLDTEITPQLKEEGILREVVRQVKDLRKTAGLTEKDVVEVNFNLEIEEVKKNLAYLQKEVNALKVTFSSNASLMFKKETVISDSKVEISLSKNGTRLSK